MGTEKDPYKLRFRHLNGDIGPLEFDESSTVGNMKGSVYDNWPENGTLAELKPENTQHLRIMYQGKILQDVLSIADLKQLPGDMEPGRLVTLHLMLAPPGQLTGQSSQRRQAEGGGGSSCCCVQ